MYTVQHQNAQCSVAMATEDDMNEADLATQLADRLAALSSSGGSEVARIDAELVALAARTTKNEQVLAVFADQVDKNLAAENQWYNEQQETKYEPSDG